MGKFHCCPVTWILCRIQRMLVLILEKATKVIYYSSNIQILQIIHQTMRVFSSCPSSFSWVSWVIFSSLPVPWEAPTKATLFIINKGWWLSADVNKEALVDRLTGTKYDSQAWSVHCLYTDSNGLVRGLKTEVPVPLCPAGTHRLPLFWGGKLSQLNHLNLL